MLGSRTPPRPATKVETRESTKVGSPPTGGRSGWPGGAGRLDHMITVENLTKRYGPHPAVDDVSFHCAPGTVTGFLGPNGAGKSTTMRMICGLTAPTAGRATVSGRPYRSCPTRGGRSGYCWTPPPSTPGGPAARR
ncbi:hypothetical protein GCM10027614_62460 [Micromonospora vulcania]